MPATSAKQSKVESSGDAEADSSLGDNHAALEDIDACQNELDALNEKASEEILKVEQKFNLLRKPHYTKRNEVCAKVPEFWFTTLSNHPQIAAILNEKETECLKFLSNVEVEEFEDVKAGYKICLTFKENPFFTNSKLEKVFNLSSEGLATSKSTSIEWKEGKDLTKENSGKELNGNRKRKLDTELSFFSWFKNNKDANNDEIAEEIKDDIWPNPLQYYLASELDSADMGDSDEEEDLDESVVELGDDSDEDPEGDEDDEDGDPAEDDDDEEDDDKDEA